MFEYLVATLCILLLVSLVALLAKLGEVKRLRYQLRYLETRYENLRRQIDAYISMSSIGSRDNEQENLDLKILELHMKGYSYGAIAKKLGVSKSTVYRRLKKLKQMQRRKRVPIPVPA